MNRAERRFVIATLVFVATYIPAFIATILLTWNSSREVGLWVGYVLFPFHSLVIVFCFAVVYLAIRDLFRRDTAELAFSRMSWLCIILGTGGWGAFPYCFFQGFKPHASVMLE